AGANTPAASGATVWRGEIGGTRSGMAEDVVLPGMRHWWHSRFGAGSGPRRTGPAALTTGSPTSSRRCRRCARMGTRDRWTAILASSSRVRRLAIAHPVLTLAAIVLTANPYWL